MTPPVSQVLSEAADLLEKPGAWTQGSFCGVANGSSSECFCAVGAIGQVIGSGRWPGSFKAERWVNRHWPIEGETAEDLEDWNDKPGRTQAQVVAKVRRAAALAKEEGK